MKYKNEKLVLLIIRYTLPILILFFSLIITIFLYFDNKTELKKLQNSTEKEFIETRKHIIKEQVDNLYDYIISEKKDIEKNLKKSLIGRVHEAHTIITNIYKEYKDTHSKKELTLMIKSAIKDIRFNSNRGYFFVYDKKAINIIHPLIPKLEGKNLINYKDTKGTYVLRESLELLKNRDESYQEWYWRKDKADMNEYKKIGFVKNIYELGWFVGTGEYVEDFSKDIQRKVISQIEKLKFGKNGYFIIVDKNMEYVSHINKDLLGVNALKKLREMNDLESIKKIETVIKQGEGFIYLDFYKPGSKIISSKVIYSKNIPKWGWAISTGFYKDDIKEMIDNQKRELTLKHEENISNLFMISIIVTLILLLISFYISLIIEKKFKSYKDSIQRHIKENQKQHELLAQKTKLAAMGEMLENIAHQWRQPLSVITTASSGIRLHKEMDTLSDEFLDESISSIHSTADHLSETIEDFRDFFKPDKKKHDFSIKKAFEKAYKLISSQLDFYEIKLINNIEDFTIINYERDLLQVLLNILNNSKDALEKCKNKKYIFIDAYKENNNVIIKIKDNAKGIDETIINRVFEPYFTTKHQSQGTGIGLYMSQEIISRHMKGSLEVENTSYEYEGNTFTGALFTIKLPLS